MTFVVFACLEMKKRTDNKYSPRITSANKSSEVGILQKVHWYSTVADASSSLEGLHLHYLCSFMYGFTTNKRVASTECKYDKNKHFMVGSQ